MWKARAPVRVRSSRALLLAASLIAVPLVAGPGSASAQGLFEALFGRGAFHHAPRVYAPAPVMLPPAERRSVTPKRIRAPQRQHVEVTKPGPYIPPPVMSGPLGRFLRDPSLRAGDVVATADGLMVFRGSPGSGHKEKDFVPLSQAKRLVARAARTELARLDKAVRRGGRDVNVSFVASNEPPIVAQDEGRAAR